MYVPDWVEIPLELALLLLNSTNSMRKASNHVSSPLGFTDCEFQYCMSNFHRWFCIYFFNVSVRLKPKLTNFSFPSIMDGYFISKMKHSRMIRIHMKIRCMVFYVSRLSAAYKFRIQTNARNTKHFVLVYDDLFHSHHSTTFEERKRWFRFESDKYFVFIC